MNRRQFLSHSTAATLAATAPMILPSQLFGKTAPSRKITIGLIGTGWHGLDVNLPNFLADKRTKVVAVCDCRLSHADKAKSMVDAAYGNSDCLVYQDFREIIGRSDIDAIVISTPDHWHVPMSLMSMRAGKDVFCEKPTLTITGGRELVDEANRLGKVFQWGIEDRSLIKYWMLAGFARTGAIGEVHSIECGQPLNELYTVEDPAPVPENLDWNLWLGPAPYTEYTPNVTHPLRWRQSVDYSGGSLTDWGAHLCDTAQVAIGMENSGPSEILGTCNTLPADSYVTVPSGYDILYRYNNGATVRVRDVATDVYIRIEGTKGWIQCKKWDGELSASNMNLFRDHSLAENPNFWPRPDREQKNFIDMVISRGQTTYHAEAGHRLSTMLHLGHQAIRSQKVIHWNPEKEAFLKDQAEHESSILYHRNARNWENSCTR